MESLNSYHLHSDYSSSRSDLCKLNFDLSFLSLLICGHGVGVWTGRLRKLVSADWPSTWNEENWHSSELGATPPARSLKWTAGSQLLELSLAALKLGAGARSLMKVLQQEMWMPQLTFHCWTEGFPLGSGFVLFRLVFWRFIYFTWKVSGMGRCETFFISCNFSNICNCQSWNCWKPGTRSSLQFPHGCRVPRLEPPCVAFPGHKQGTRKWENSEDKAVAIWDARATGGGLPVSSSPQCHRLSLFF